MPTRRSRLGSRGEGLARDYLLGQGYQVLEANYPCQWEEVDLVALDGDTLVFVEVQTRHGTAFGSPEESLTRTKSQKLIATAQTSGA